MFHRSSGTCIHGTGKIKIIRNPELLTSPSCILVAKVWHWFGFSSLPIYLRSTRWCPDPRYIKIMSRFALERYKSVQRLLINIHWTSRNSEIQIWYLLLSICKCCRSIWSETNINAHLWSHVHFYHLFVLENVSSLWKSSLWRAK